MTNDEWGRNPFTVPKSKAQIEEERLEKEEKARERAAKGHLSLHVQGLMGGIWLANPEDETKLDATSVKRFGMRLTYGLSSLLAVEVDAVGASSGESRFEDVDFNGQQGDMVRSAKLGRVTLGGVIRMGVHRYIPVVRVGLGLQGASHDAELEVGGVRMVGPEVGFDVDFLWYFGAGMDVRLGESLVAGFGVSGNKLVGLAGATGSSGSIEAGVHLGYSWKP